MSKITPDHLLRSAMFTSASLPLIKFTATTKAGDDGTASLSEPDS
jgi:hypothetical protein